MATDVLRIIIEVIDKNVKQTFQKVDTAVANLNNTMRKTTGLLIGAGLGFLFTGMAIQRFFQNLLLSLLQNFMMIEGESGYVNNRINDLLASLYYIGWQLIDIAVSSGIFDEWADKIQNLIDWFDSLDSGTKKWLIDFIAKMVLVGIGLVIIGQLLTSISAIMSFIGLISSIAWIPWLLILGGIIAAVSILNSDLDPLVQFLFLISAVLLTMLGAAALLGVALGLPFIIAGFLIAAFMMMAKHVGGVQNAVKAFGIFFLAVLAFIGDAIFEAFITPLKIVVDLINKIIRAFNQLTGKNYKTIELPQSFAMSRKVWEMRNQLLAEAEKNKGTEVPAYQAPQIPQNINIYGDVNGDNTLDKLKQQFNEWQAFSNGAPQSSR